MIMRFDPHPMGETLRNLELQRAALIGLNSTEPTRLLLCSRPLDSGIFAATIVDALFVPASLSVMFSESHTDEARSCHALYEQGMQFDPATLTQLGAPLPASAVGCMPIHCSECPNQNGWSPTSLPILLPDVAPLFTQLLKRLRKGFETVLERKKADFCWHGQDATGHSG